MVSKNSPKPPNHLISEDIEKFESEMKKIIDMNQAIENCFAQK